MTRWQALEYITAQNLERRAFALMNCITVVPGAIGAWRRSAGQTHQLKGKGQAEHVQEVAVIKQAL